MNLFIHINQVYGLISLCRLCLSQLVGAETRWIYPSCRPPKAAHTVHIFSKHFCKWWPAGHEHGVSLITRGKIPCWLFFCALLQAAHLPFVVIPSALLLPETWKTLLACAPEMFTAATDIVCMFGCESAYLRSALLRNGRRLDLRVPSSGEFACCFRHS